MFFIDTYIICLFGGFLFAFYILFIISKPQLKKKIKKEKNISNETKKNKKKSCVPKSLKIKVWEYYIGECYSGSCYCCKNKIYVHNFHTAHVVASALGGKDELENLRPTCSLCNLSCGTQNLEEFKSKYFSEKQKQPQNLLGKLFLYLLKKIF